MGKKVTNAKPRRNKHKQGRKVSSACIAADAAARQAAEEARRSAAQQAAKAAEVALRAVRRAETALRLRKESNERHEKELKAYEKWYEQRRKDIEKQVALVKDDC